MKDYTCLLCVKRSTLCPCFFHNFNKASTTIIFPALFQCPYSIDGSFSSKLLPLNTLGPPVARSAWLQILRSCINPENTLNMNVLYKIQTNLVAIVMCL